MAEAGNVQMETENKKFYCYECNSEIPHVLDDFTCPTCHGGFIEEREASSVQQEALFGPNNDPTELDFLSLLRGAVPTQMRQGSGQDGNSSGPQFSVIIDTNRRQGANNGGGQRQNMAQNPVENMLYTFLTDLITGLGGGNQAGGMGLPVISNLGDYAWGRDGLDAIVTQLMNQMEGTGPPPLPQEKLDTLDSVKITKEQVDKKLQCSVCWDDFKLDEDVKQLDCEHVYHSDCILPWLKLHGTCPICRKDLTTGENEEQQGENVSSTNPSNVANSPLRGEGASRTSGQNPGPPGLFSFFANSLVQPPTPNNPINPNTPSNNSSGQQQQQQQQQQQGQQENQGQRDPRNRNRSPTNRNLQMDFDFD